MRSITAATAPTPRAPRRTRLFRWLARAVAARRERRALARLDAHLLDDLGLRRGAAWSEANRPFWDLPDDRRR